MPKGKRGGGKRRSTKGLQTVTRSYIENLIKKVDRVYDLREDVGTHYNRMARLRLKGLIALLYMSGRRISELCGRTYRYGDGRPPDVYKGVTLNDFQIGEIKGHQVLRMRCRILKKGSWKKGLKEQYGIINMRLEDPLMEHVSVWLEWMQKQKHFKDESRVFKFCRVRAYQLLTDVDPKVWLHWMRHQRFTHLAETMDPYELKEYAVWESIEPAADYVHRAPGRLLEKVEQADKLAR